MAARIVYSCSFVLINALALILRITFCTFRNKVAKNVPVTRGYRIFGHRSTYGILKHTMFRKLDLLLSSDEVAGNTNFIASVRELASVTGQPMCNYIL
jgi:hypothetical protein